jgi:2-C-methyl-D-erythritol 4-phosphate cytidylyltransferase
VIAAAGSGERLGAGGPKALVELAGRPMLAWSLDAFEAAESVAAVVIAAPPGNEDAISAVAPAAVVVTGADARSQSVGNALERVDTELVAVHDAARPLVTADLIDALVARLAARPDADGVIAAAPLTDTVKRVDGPTVSKTESREHLWAAQTPQAFRTDALREAHAADPQRVAAATDDAMLIEEDGGTVLIEPTPASNLKVTTPEDLRVAEALLGAR